MNIQEYSSCSIVSSNTNDDLCHLEQITYLSGEESRNLCGSVEVKKVLEFCNGSHFKTPCNIATMESLLLTPTWLPNRSLIIVFPGTILRSVDNVLFAPCIIHYKLGRHPKTSVGNCNLSQTLNNSVRIASF